MWFSKVLMPHFFEGPYIFVLLVVRGPEELLCPEPLGSLGAIFYPLRLSGLSVSRLDLFILWWPSKLVSTLTLLTVTRLFPPGSVCLGDTLLLSLPRSKQLN